jgi:predicted alpha/beta superfamily hydrolase
MKFKPVFFLLLLSTVALAQERNHTASKNVKILPNEMEMPGLGRSRTIRLYLPPNYEGSKKDYAVLYMHDGQNLFDDATSYVGEWGVDEILDDLYTKQGFELIVVGIDNGQEKRMSELSPWENAKYGKAEGKEYMEFIVDVVKAYIDKNYRTKSDRENTAIMGSSMGGLISHYAIYQYPEVFSKAGIYSPSYWYAKGAFDIVEEKPVRKDARLYFFVGQKEGEMMVKPMQDMVNLILKDGHPSQNLKSKVDPNGEHNERTWRSDFENSVLWLFQK